MVFPSKNVAVPTITHATYGHRVFPFLSQFFEICLVLELLSKLLLSRNARVDHVPMLIELLIHTGQLSFQLPLSKRLVEKVCEFQFGCLLLAFYFLCSRVPPRSHPV